ncbi:MAG: hypothetical protein O7G87_02120 [bacterium]|nr:hypothetical protein [bacterium]
MKKSILFVMLTGLLLAGVVPLANAQEDNDEIQMTKADSVKLSGRHLSFGGRYLNSKQYEDAEIQLKKAWGYNPTRSTTARYLGKLYKETDRLDDSIEWYKKSTELDPKSKYARGAYQVMTELYIYQENRLEAIEAYKTLLNDFQNSTEQEIQILHGLVSLLIEEKNMEEALEYAKLWGELAPDSPDVRDMIAKLHLSTGEEDAALVEIEKVLEMNPKDFVTLENLAGMYANRGDSKKAYNAYRKLHNNTPDNYLYIDNLFNLGKQLGKSERSQTSLLNKMVKLQPNNLSVIEQLAEKTGGIYMINRGLKQDARNGKLNYLKGQFYYNKWKAAKALSDSTNAMKYYRIAHKDPQWEGLAKRMIDEIDPPLTVEEIAKRAFFKEKAKEEIKQEGKK